MDGQERFFCCWICARAYVQMVEAVKGKTGWPGLDTVELQGDFRGREGIAVRAGERYAFRFSFDPETGDLQRFEASLD